MGVARLLPLALLALLQESGPDKGQDTPPTFDAGFASITEKDLLVHIAEIASPALEGRDSPSEGLTRAGDYIIGRLKAAGVEPGAPDGGFRMGYSLEKVDERPYEAPVPEQCLLAMEPKGGAGEELRFVLEEDYVPLPSCPGQGEGPLTFFGFGITESAEKRYDDLKGRNCKGEIVMILEGEPRSKKLFEGPLVTQAADVYAKAKALEDRGAQGVLVVRRPPAEQFDGLDGRPVAPTPIGFRYTWAPWNTDAPNIRPTLPRAHLKIPVLEINEATATKLLGEDVAELAAKIESSGKPIRRERKDVRVSLSAGMEKRPAELHNVVGLLRGTDAKLCQEYVVLGAHYDHIGVDGWGRVACGADDNGSGTCGLLELAEAFALSRPKRSLLFAWFCSEEDGDLGSEEFCARPPVAKDAMIAMLNMDMVGCVDAEEVVVLGCRENPGFEDVLKEARKLRPTELKRVFTDKGYDLWERSDHFSFHQVGIPVLFFLESEKDSDNPDYHTYRDTIDRLSIPKVARVTRLVFNTAWLIANEPKRPPSPR